MYFLQSILCVHIVTVFQFLKLESWLSLRLFTLQNISLFLYLWPSLALYIKTITDFLEYSLCISYLGLPKQNVTCLEKTNLFPWNYIDWKLGSGWRMIRTLHQIFFWFADICCLTPRMQVELWYLFYTNISFYLQQDLLLHIPCYNLNFLNGAPLSNGITWYFRTSIHELERINTSHRKHFLFQKRSLYKFCSVELR